MIPCALEINLSTDGGGRKWYAIVECYLVSFPQVNNRISINIVGDKNIDLAVERVEHHIKHDQRENFLSVITRTLEVDEAVLGTIAVGIIDFFGEKVQSSEKTIAPWHAGAVKAYRDPKNQEAIGVRAALDREKLEPTRENFMGVYAALFGGSRLDLLTNLLVK
jgi:hypothetical protein